VGDVRLPVWRETSLLQLFKCPFYSEDGEMRWRGGAVDPGIADECTVAGGREEMNAYHNDVELFMGT